jgi:hypothetical protein
MHIYAFLFVQKKYRPSVGKNRLPMKKSNVRFFHGEPVFSDKRLAFFPEHQELHKYALPDFQLIPPSTFLIPGATGATGATTVISYARA